MFDMKGFTHAIAGCFSRNSLPLYQGIQSQNDEAKDFETFTWQYFEAERLGLDGSVTIDSKYSGEYLDSFSPKGSIDLHTVIQISPGHLWS